MSQCSVCYICIIYIIICIIHYVYILYANTHNICIIYVCARMQYSLARQICHGSLSDKSNTKLPHLCIFAVLSLWLHSVCSSPYICFVYVIIFTLKKKFLWLWFHAPLTWHLPRYPIITQLATLVNPFPFSFCLASLQHLSKLLSIYTNHSLSPALFLHNLASVCSSWLIIFSFHSIDELISSTVSLMGIYLHKHTYTPIYLYNYVYLYM